MKAAEIRSKFVEYFKSKGHTHVASSSLVPQNDPTLLFTNSGMVQFKDVFLGKDPRSYKRATTFQKCVRAGGKHNDLENVGYTARHHTFFEMLGNFSFGDYFKSDAISYAWEFVTEVLKLPKDKLYVTVFRDDDEAADIWHKEQGVPTDRIFRLGEKDNFWSMGDTGPCGPCTEIFYDLGADFGCGKSTCTVGCDCDRYMEFWNLVFMQFDRDQTGRMTPLPKPSVDTGSGLERVAMIMQHARSNYDTDLFADVIAGISKISGKNYVAGSKDSVPFRVIADHARSASFLISDGVIPSNEGRGYVLRRIIRRAIRYGKNLGFEAPFLNQICGLVVDKMVSAYPELRERRNFIERCVKAEEEQFYRTLEHGLAMLEESTAALEPGAVLAGDVAFKLYDTYGFPLDLTALIVREKDIRVDEAGFQKAMEEQKDRSRRNWKGTGQKTLDAAYHEIAGRLREKSKLPVFKGYDHESVSSGCSAILIHTGEGVVEVDEANAASSSDGIVELVFESTPFYGESGGQAGDRGIITSRDFEAEVTDVQKPLPDLIVAHARIQRGSIRLGHDYQQIVAARVRALTRRNHTATHLLHEALRNVLGSHVKQAGSLVSAELLRFDFNHFQALSPEELAKVEELVNEQIWSGSPVKINNMNKDEAIAAGAIAFFGEKYGDTVRVVSAGTRSVELCGGTHVSDLSEIQLFRVISESAIASGVRRMVAYTSQRAFEYLRERDVESRSVRDILKLSNGPEVEQRLHRMIDHEKSLRRELEKFEAQKLEEHLRGMIAKAPVHAGYPMVIHELPADERGMKLVRDMVEMARQLNPKAIVLIGMEDSGAGKVFVAAGVGAQSAKSVKANELINQLNPIFDAKGGGKPDMAQSGGSKLGVLTTVLKQGQELILQKLNS
jgi:alanyl-tRNA synthetase